LVAIAPAENASSWARRVRVFHGAQSVQGTLHVKLGLITPQSFEFNLRWRRPYFRSAGRAAGLFDPHPISGCSENLVLGLSAVAESVDRVTGEEHYVPLPARRSPGSVVPVKTTRIRNAVPGLFGLIVLIADVWAIVNVFQSSADTGKKVLWTVLVIILPVLGFILWYFLGKTAGKG